MQQAAEVDLDRLVDYKTDTAPLSKNTRSQATT